VRIAVLSSGTGATPRAAVSNPLLLFHFFGLFALAAVHPVYSLLSQESHAPFLIAHKMQPWDVAIFVTAASVIIPLGLWFVCLLAAVFSRRAGQLLSNTILATLTALIFLPFADRWFALAGVSSAFAAVGLALGLGITATWLYSTRPWARTGVSILSLGGIIAPLIFLTSAPVQSLFAVDAQNSKSHAPIRSPAPDIVLVIFDELPLLSLLDEQLKIDKQRYPNFYRLSQTSTWYRNTSSVHYSTASAIASLMTGEYYENYRKNIDAGHGAGGGGINVETVPDNLFSLLGDVYEIHAAELLTHLAPENSNPENVYLPSLDQRLKLLFADTAVVYLHYLVPLEWRFRVPPIEGQWAGFTTATQDVPPDSDWPFVDSYKRLEVVRNFVNSLQPRAEPSIYFLHTLMPHFPYEYNDRGQKFSSVLPFLSMNFRKAPGHNTWPDEQAANLAYQAHLFQLQFTDKLLGRILDRLEQTGLFDDALVVVTSDHGTSFFWDDENRSAEELAKIQSSGTLFVPLLVKFPEQTKGEISDTPMQTIDIVPTLADYLGRPLSWAHSGISAFDIDSAARERRSNLPTPFSFEFASTDELAALQYKFELFGSGESDSLYQLGPNRDLLGRNVQDFRQTTSGMRFSLDSDGLPKGPDPDSPRFPAYLRGSITLTNGGNFSSNPILVVAQNGTIKASVQTSPYDLAHMMPDSSGNTSEDANKTGVSGSKRYFIVRMSPENLAEDVEALSLFALDKDSSKPDIVLARIEALEDE
jgi:hypothetical protein